ncbi:hypothetical protein C5167_016753 [Papaver somniferum]|nr:hypothetical protein C5167_016753 [Papaver somniferum]
MKVRKEMKMAQVQEFQVDEQLEDVQIDIRSLLQKKDNKDDDEKKEDEIRLLGIKALEVERIKKVDDIRNKVLQWFTIFTLLLAAYVNFICDV